jgi:hypothetical protein
MDKKKLGYINFTMKEINDASDDIYESYFDSTEDFKSSVIILITILNSIINDLENE